MSKARNAVVGLAVVFGVAQFFQPNRSNPATDPAVSFEAVVKPARLAAGALDRACRDCHTNRTAWPWYSKVAPISWVVADDVRDGRLHLNFSRWDIYSTEMSALRIRDVCREASRGDMPPWYYRAVHSRARLDGEEVAALCGLAP